MATSIVRYSWLLICALLLASCAAPKVQLQEDRAKFYKEKALEIYQEEAELDAAVYAQASVEERIKKAQLQGSKIAFWTALMSELEIGPAFTSALMDALKLAGPLILGGS
jgi:hypothetical protein